MANPKLAKGAASGRMGACRVCASNFSDGRGSYLAAGQKAPAHDGRNGKHCPGSGHALLDDGPM